MIYGIINHVNVIDEYKNVTSGDTFPERIFMNEINNSFDQVVEIINHARENAFRKVNEAVYSRNRQRLYLYR